MNEGRVYFIFEVTVHHQKKNTGQELEPEYIKNHAFGLIPLVYLATFLHPQTHMSKVGRALLQQLVIKKLDHRPGHMSAYSRQFLS